VPRRLQVYEADGITVTYDPALCIHAAECVRRQPEVFDPRRKRWIRPELASPEVVAEAVAACPTGALQCERTAAEGAAPATPASQPVVITVGSNGPLTIRGPVRILTEGGDVLRETDRVTLCRCGATANPPFCDGSHDRIGFRPT
jgi:uncharacterized Fe-S cluster protein YjdI